MIHEVIGFIILLLLMVGFHEFGHIAIAGDGAIGIDNGKIYTEYSNKNNYSDKLISFGGIVFGFVPILLCAGLYGYLSFFMIALYLLGIRDDMRILRGQSV